MGILAVALGATAIGVAAAVGLLRRRFVLVDVDGTSMEPAFRSGDRVLVRRTGLAGVHRGDVVVVERPRRPGDWADPAPVAGLRGRSWMIKRAAAVPGDDVPEQVAAAVRATAAGPGTGERVPPGHLVVLGDNAGASLDSRSCGYFPASRVLGVVIRR